MRKVLLIVVTLMVGLVFTGAAKAEQATQPAHKEAKEGTPAKHEFQGLDLTKDQKDKIKVIRTQAKADAEKATTKEEKEKIHKAANLKIRTEVLTEKQRQQLEQAEQAEKAKEVKHEPKQHKAPTSQPMGAHH
jgi:Spy/CpxP family protein refolding chaperone